MVVVSHAGKLVKVAGGVMNTTPGWRTAGWRSVVMPQSGADQVLCRRLMEVATVDAESLFWRPDSAGR
ncbi:MAG: hypothetical protein ACLTYN_03810 [Dysosmobacter welbionis]